MIPLLLIVIVGALASLALTPVIREAAQRVQFVDRPDGKRKVQETPVALGGGLVLLLAGTVTTVFACSTTKFAGSVIEEENWSLLSLLFGAIVLCIVGLFDDLRGMRGGYKLLWQVVVSSVIVGTGLIVDKVGLFGVAIPLGIFGFLFSLLWILAAVNSFNLIDGIDGLATTVGLILSLTIGIMAVYTGKTVDAVIAFALAGTLLGFLRYNFAPATIYLGDAGSMLIGLALGTLALRCTFKEAATVAFAGPLAIWAIPMFDSIAALLRRKLTGRSMYATDRGHIHHRLLTRGLSARQAVVLIGALCLVTAGAAVVALVTGYEWVGPFAVVFVLGVLVTTRLFGHTELMLLNSRIFGFGRLFPNHDDFDRASLPAERTCMQLQGSLPWEKAWEALVESAPRFHLIRIHLNLNLPQRHEDFFASWRSGEKTLREDVWSIDVPLTVDGEVVGRLKVEGTQCDSPCLTQMGDLLEFLAVFETHLADVLRAEPIQADVPLPENDRAAIPVGPSVE
jgi:UDP-GlcNAc:undecaprenyl-phosphate GlcNAc-1-phosphate transferase